MMSTLDLTPVDASLPFLLVMDVRNGRIAARGDLDRGQVHRLAEVADRVAESPATFWSMDVSAVTFCDVAGLRGLLEVQRVAARDGRRLQITRPRPWLRHLLDIAGDATAGGGPAQGSPPARA